MTTDTEILKTGLAEGAGLPASTEPTPQTPPQGWQSLVEKARKEEKDKVMPQIESLKAKLEASERASADREAEILRLKASATPEEASRASLARMEQSLRETSEKTAKLESELALTREVAAQELRNMGLKLHREKVIAEKKVLLPELVTGSTEAEIEAAAETALRRQNELAEAARAQVRQEQSANVPSPVSPSANAPRVGAPSDLRALGKLPKKDYEAIRAQMFASATTR